MDTNQDVLAKISPRYQLQYKIDLALKELYTSGDMNEQGEVFENSSVNYDVTASDDTTSDDVTQSDGVNLTKSPERDDQTSSPESRDEQGLADEFHYDVTEREEAPVPMPRRKKKQNEAMRDDSVEMENTENKIPDIQIDHVDTQQPITDDQIIITPEYENTPAMMTSQSSSSDSDSVTSSDEGEEDFPTNDVIPQDIELEHVNNDVNKQDQLADDDVIIKQEPADDVTEIHEVKEVITEIEKEKDEAESQSRESSSDEAESDDENCSYDLTIDKNEDDEMPVVLVSKTLIDDVTTSNDDVINNKDTQPNINLEEDTEVSYDVTEGSDDVTEISNNVIEVGDDVTATSNDVVADEDKNVEEDGKESKTIDDENSNYDVTIEKQSDRDDAEATSCNPAEQIAPQLAENVIVSAIKEVITTSQATVNNPTDALEENSTQISEIETQNPEIEIEEVKPVETVLSSNIKDDASSVSSSDSSKAEEYEKTTDEKPVEVVTEDVSVQNTAEEHDIATSDEYRDSTPKADDSEIVLFETTKVLSEVNPENSESQNQEMRIIERTGLVNHDEIPEEENGPAVYSAAHSQRNTDATKWFGQSKPKEKVWLKPSGKVDTNAESERRKVIKAMTRKHNPNYVPKWQPPPVKDLTEDLAEKERKSLEMYEARRRKRILSSEDGSIAEEKVLEERALEEVKATEEETRKEEQSEETYPTDVTTPQSPGPIAPKPLKKRQNSEIVIESVVHSKDAINVWESRLSSKQQKEEEENKRLAAGKLKRRESEQRKSRERTESMSSVSSSASQSELPTNEFIIRESIGISNIRNRWKDREEQSRDQPSPTFRKAPRRTKSFTVETGAPYRSYSKPPTKIAPVVNRPSTPENYITDVTMSRAGESAINREIREAAEREERYRLELEKKAIEKKLAESTLRDDVTSTSPTPPITPKVTSPPKVAPKTRKSVKSDNPSKNSVTSPKSPPTSPNVTEDVIVPKVARRPTMDDMNVEALEHHDTGADSGIECNASGPTARSDVTSPISDNGRHRSSSIGTSGGHDDEYASSELSTTSQEEEAQKGSDAVFQRPRITPLPNVVSPKGWGQKTSVVSPVSPRPKFTIKSASNSEIQLPSKTTPTPVNGIDKKQQPKQEPQPQKQAEKQQDSPKLVLADEDLPAGTSKRTITVNRQLSGPSFEVVSSKNRLQTIMEQEMREAQKREEEWKQKQLEHQNIVAKGGVKTPDTPVSPASPRRNHTPTKAAMNMSPQQVLPNGDGAKRISTPEPEKETQTEVKLRNATSSEYKKNTVVKANRVPRRKSNMAMMWESGNFKNNDD